jgi:hypothetical protein
MTQPDEAHEDARRFRRFAWAFRVAMVVICGTYWFASSSPPVDRAFIDLLQALSIQALVATYDAKAEAALAKAASLENPPMSDPAPPDPRT